MNKQELLSRLTFAKDAAFQAAKLIRQELRRGVTIRHKGPNDIVTQVDLVVERYLADAIHVAFPEDQIYGEEMGGDCACAQRRWIIDPIDGTENFSRGIAEYAISIGFESTPGELVMGVVYAPAMGEMFWAAQGMGAYLNDQPIHVSTQNDPQFAVTAVAPPFRRHELTHRYFATVEMLFQNTCDTRNTGSAALHGCYVACGRVEAYIEADVMPYDIAAALAIISEAGGNWGSLYSQGHPFETHEILCSNSLLYPWYRQCCQRSDAP